MNVLVYGCGAVGLGIAASLYNACSSVDLIASKRTKNAIDNKGIMRTGLFGNIKVSVGEVTTFSEISHIKNKKYDFILVCTKTLANIETAEKLGANKHLLNSEGKIVLFQNGWGNDEPYLKYFDKHQLYSARVITGFQRPELYISEITVHAAPLLIGSLYNEPLIQISPLAAAINEGCLPCEITNDVGKALWAKMLYNCTLNPLGAILKVNYGKLVESENSIFIMDRIIEEIFSVMLAAGHTTYWDSANAYKDEFYQKLVPSTASHRSSTLQDIEKKVKTEIDSLTGSVVKLGVKHNVAVPYNTMLYNLIKTIESNF